MCPDELKTDDLMRMFAKRDAERAERAKKAAHKVVKYQPKVHEIKGTMAVGSSYLESSPGADEFVPSSAYRSGRSSSLAGGSRSDGGIEHSRYKSAPEASGHSRTKNTPQTRKNVKHLKDTRGKKSHYSPKRAAKSRNAKLNSLEKTVLGIASGAAIGATALVAAFFSTPNRDSIEITADKFEHEPGVRIYETDDAYAGINSYTLGAKDGEEYTLEIDEEGNAVVNVGKDAAADSVVDKVIDASCQEQINNINFILDKNSDIKDAFNDTEIALRRASIEYGGDVLELLEEMNDKFGLGRLPLEWQISLLEHESSGFFTDWQTGEVIVRSNGDTGWYQVTDVVEEDFDRIAKFLVKRGVAQEDVDEIKALGRSSMRGNAGYGAMYLSYLNILFDGDIEKVLSGFNAGEGFVSGGNIREGYVRECYGEHIEPLSRYDNALWKYIINKDYGEFEDDGIVHVYVNSEDGSVRYPD